MSQRTCFKKQLCNRSERDNAQTPQPLRGAKSRALGGPVPALLVYTLAGSAGSAPPSPRPEEARARSAPSMAYSLYHSVLVAVHTKDNPTDEEWSGYVDFGRKQMGKYTSSLVISEGGGPNAT